MAIRFFLHHVNYRIGGKKKIKTCVKGIITDYKRREGEINIIITTDRDLLEINKKYLKRDYFTDIISFDLSKDESISGDLYISIDRVKENAKLFNVKKEVELLRVIIHGVLHLLGYKDKGKQERKKMTEKEDYYIEIYYKKRSVNL